jgi:hypothetical protein
MSGCNRCPESVKASLVFLSHRAIIQKAELSGSWKKGFFKKIWERLHVERSWTEEDDSEDMDVDDEASVSSEEESDDEPGNAEGNTMSSDSDDDNEDASGDNMDVLIKAAAIWLTEQDQVNDSGTRNGNNGKTSPLSGFKRSLPSSRKDKKRGSSLTSGKRRRVHF